MERETVFPHCSCIRPDSHHKYLNVTTSSDGETCDRCACYVLWKPMSATVVRAGKDSDDDIRFKHSQKAFFFQEYKVCL